MTQIPRKRQKKKKKRPNTTYALKNVTHIHPKPKK